jgi:hypothetical protein
LRSVYRFMLDRRVVLLPAAGNRSPRPPARAK